MDIKKAVIVKCYPKANLDGKDEAYINARYDASVESLEIEKEAQARTVINGEPNKTTDSADDSRSKYIARLKNHGQKEDK